MEHCRSGRHEITPENRRITKNGHSECLPCRRLAQKAAQARRRKLRRKDRPTAPYPPYTGDEPCVGEDMHPPSHTGIHQDTFERPLVDVCIGCGVVDACREWAVHHERWGVWGGTTAADRDYIRRSRGLHVLEPTLNLDVEIIRARAAREAANKKEAM